METMDVAPTYARPVIDRSASEFDIVDRVARYRKAEIRAVTLGATDASRGWEPLAFFEPGKEPRKSRQRGVGARRGSSPLSSRFGRRDAPGGARCQSARRSRLLRRRRPGR